jgi:hypothetical protein
VGRYRQDYLGDAVVARDQRGLTLTLLGRTTPLEHWHYDTYRTQWTNALARAVLPLVSFERDGAGRVRRLRFERREAFERVR